MMAPSSALLFALALCCPTAVSGHASMIVPPPRNAWDAELPPWQHGKHPNTGWIEPYNCRCTNGTNGECNSGQACFWFSQGCTIGCEACDGQGARYPSWDHCPGTAKLAAFLDGTYLDKKYWTANQNATPGSVEDIWRFHPWRAPGHAPVWDACGMAGGVRSEMFNAGAYNSTANAKQGDLGSVVLRPRPTGTVWRRGGTAAARWQMTAQHGGGYRFRLCPKGRALTEACFQEHPLDFANTATHTALFSDRSVKIAATHVEEGPAKGWMRMPVPDFDTHPCDYRVPAGEHCQTSCPGCGSPWYAADSACPTNCAKAFPGLPAVASADPHVFTDPLPGANFHEYAIEDELRVPTDLPPGEYVLGWRWDAEMTSQVWSSCADITLL